MLFKAKVSLHDQMGIFMKGNLKMRCLMERESIDGVIKKLSTKASLGMVLFMGLASFTI